MDRYDIKDYDFHLPPGQIAQYPAVPRDHSRLLVVDRQMKTLEDRKFYQLTDYLTSEDILVLNETKVIPGRLSGVKQGTGGRVEILLLRRQGEDWECLVRPARRLKRGTRLVFGQGRMFGDIIDDLDMAGGKLIRFSGFEDWDNILNGLGQMPLPPYLNRQAEPGDLDDYQTVYAQTAGSAAAPTAGLHFTSELLAQLDARGVEIVKVTLHVGLGTFRPVETTDIRDHRMHAEVYELRKESAERLNLARQSGKRIVAVGTTSVRTLETTWVPEKGFVPGIGETSIFIYPGYRYQAVDRLITNFHLPRSSLLMLVYAFGGRDLMRHAYEQAIASGYRFYSYGDAMLII